jgi:hypothetical protein
MTMTFAVGVLAGFVLGLVSVWAFLFWRDEPR